MEPTDAAYLAGLLDGEGSYMIQKRRNGPYTAWLASIAMTSTDAVLVWRCVEIVGGSVSGPTKPKSQQARPAWVWSLRGSAVGPAIEAMWPYIVLKRRQAALVHALRKRMTNGAAPGRKGRAPLDAHELYVREIMRDTCSALNRRGTVPLTDETRAVLATCDLLGLIEVPQPSSATPVR